MRIFSEGGRRVEGGLRHILGIGRRGRVSFLLLFYSLPRLIRFLAIIINIFSTTISKMSILMAYLTLERDLLVVDLLDVGPIVHFEFDGFR